MQDVSPEQPSRENARSKWALNHRHLKHPIFNFATCKSRASNALKRVSMFVEIAEGLILCPKRRLETTRLPSRTDRQNECNGLPLASFGLWNDPDVLGHGSPFSVRKSIRSASDPFRAGRAKPTSNVRVISKAPSCA